MNRMSTEEMGQLSERDKKMMGVSSEQDKPDLDEAAILEIQERLEQQRDVSDLSPQELAAFGIKKTVNKDGIETYDHGYSPDTGKITKEFRGIKLETKKVSVTPEEEEAMAARANTQREQDEARWAKMKKEGNLPRLPSEDDGF